MTTKQFLSGLSHTTRFKVIAILEIDQREAFEIRDAKTFLECVDHINMILMSFVIDKNKKHP